MSVIFIIDIDGTICDSLGRITNVADDIESPDLWTDQTMKEFLSEENIMGDDIIPGSNLVFKLADICHASIIFLTGRNDYARHATRKWLTEIFRVPPDIPLIMRPYAEKGDYAAECKEKLFLKHVYSLHPDATFIFFEDEHDTAERYAKYGLVLKSPGCWNLLKEVYNDE
jgi:hypothetical protein